MDISKNVCIRPEQQQWRDGIGGLRVVSLHEFETKSTALVFWPKNELFQPHTHMSQHYPRVEEESLILVKVRHL